MNFPIYLIDITSEDIRFMLDAGFIRLCCHQLWVDEKSEHRMGGPERSGMSMGLDIVWFKPDII